MSIASVRRLPYERYIGGSGAGAREVTASTFTMLRHFDG